jgi:sigma-E factor negative regulatory protein RseB
MMPRSWLPILTMAMAALAGPAWSQCGGEDKTALRWLDRMSHSLRETSYQGVFAYQHGRTVQSMRISHSVTGNVETEEVTRLTGSGERVVRTEHPLDCIHPGHRLVRIGKLYDESSDDCGIAEFYRLKMGNLERVAGRSAIVLNVLPRDMYRYGYQMAIDTETGLLLKTQTMAQDGKILERFQFADLKIGKFESDGTQVDVILEASHAFHAEPDFSEHAENISPWRVHWLPAGFELTEGEGSSGRDKTFTDGLAVFTVFLEQMPDLAQPGEGRARQGGTTAYTRGLAVAGEPILVTVLGEVPINTARMVADSIAWENSSAD